MVSVIDGIFCSAFLLLYVCMHVHTYIHTLPPFLHSDCPGSAATVITADRSYPLPPGGPGSNKSAHCERVAALYPGWTHLSCGWMLRDLVSDQLVRDAPELMAIRRLLVAGELLPQVPSQLPSWGDKLPPLPPGSCVPGSLRACPQMAVVVHAWSDAVPHGLILSLRASP